MPRHWMRRLRTTDEILKKIVGRLALAPSLCLPASAVWLAACLLFYLSVSAAFASANQHLTQCVCVRACVRACVRVRVSVCGACANTKVKEYRILD